MKSLLRIELCILLNKSNSKINFCSQEIDSLYAKVLWILVISLLQEITISWIYKGYVFCKLGVVFGYEYQKYQKAVY